MCVSEREGHIDRQTRKTNRKDRKIIEQDRHAILTNFQRQTEEAGRQDLRSDRQREIYRQKERQIGI